MIKFNNQDSMSNYVIGREKLIKSNLSSLFSLLYKLKKNECLFLFPSSKTKDSSIILQNVLEKQGFQTLKNWPKGTISNLYQLSQSYKYRETYNKLLQLDFQNVQYIFLKDINSVPASVLKEIQFIRSVLNIRIISYIDVRNFNDIQRNLIDIPLYFNNDPLGDLYYPTDKLLDYFLVNFYLTKK